MTWTLDGDVGLGLDLPSASLQIQRDEAVVALRSSGTAMPTLPNDYSGIAEFNGELLAIDADGNATSISPHNEAGDWIFYSKNTRTGRVVHVNMIEMIESLETITGERFLQSWSEPKGAPKRARPERELRGEMITLEKLSEENRRLERRVEQLESLVRQQLEGALR
ncbi:MAG: hypothetical protein AAF658_12210 [Myxococcota bacterium]